MSATITITTSAEADAFMRNYLTRPTDVTARLVFADWLEETCEPHNIAWAYYIRLKAESANYNFYSRERRELDHQAEEYAPTIRAKLTIPAALFVGYPKSLLQLLPAPNITVKLADFEISQEKLYFLPESVARENLVFPLDEQNRTLLVASANPLDTDLAQTLAFILNREIVLVTAEPEDILHAIDFAYEQIEPLDAMLLEFVDISIELTGTHPRGELTQTDPPVVRLVNLLLQTAIDGDADRVLIYPDLDAIGIRFRIETEWVEHDRMPMSFLPAMTNRLALMAQLASEWMPMDPNSGEPLTGTFAMLVHGAHFRVRVTIQPSPDGPTTQIDLIRELPITF